MRHRHADSHPTLLANCRSAPDFSIESEHRRRGARLIAGIDEAGRGPLAGPVVAAAVIFDGAHPPAGLDDSKRLTRSERERLFGEILSSAVVAVGTASAQEIDDFNIRQATLLAMCRALDGLAQYPCHTLIDGADVPTALTARATAVVKGDQRSLSIAAASIVAKVTRDRLMSKMCLIFPAYGFSGHMGYGTPRHVEALKIHGPCPYHRRTFAPVRDCLAKT